MNNRFPSGWCFPTRLVAGLVGLVLLTIVPASGAKEFVVSGTAHELRDVTDQTEIFFRSMRLNPVQKVWNVDVTVANLSDETLPAPIVVLVDSYAGTSEPLSPDGLDDSQPSKPFYDMTGFLAGSSLPANRATSVRTLSLAFSDVPPDLNVRVFAGQAIPPVALAVARSLDSLGQPLTDVDLTIDGPAGHELRKTDSVYGVASVGQAEGEHLMLFEKEGFLPVWRNVVLSESEVTVVASPRLTKRSGMAWAVNAMGGQTVTNKTGTIEATLRPQSVSQSAEVFLTPVDGQSLPSLLPRGWSPLQAFWIETSGPALDVVDARLTPWGPVANSESAALVKWNPTSLVWETMRVVNGAGPAAVAVQLDGAGAYALVVPDAGVLAPPAAQVGAPLPGSAAELPDLAGLSATGEVNPMSSPASTVPEMVTGTATLEVRHDAEPLPSGFLFRGEVTETYVLADGSLRLTPQYENFIVGYQRPGDTDDYSLHATFPIRPLLLFGSDQLDEATVKVDVLANTGFDGSVLDVAGGLVNADGVRIVVADGQLNKPSAFRLRRIDGEIFSGQLNENQSVIAAFDLTVDRSTLNSPLRLEITGVPAEKRFVLARVLSTSGLYGLQPVERLVSGVDGNLTTLEPETGERLPGLEGSGQFVLIEVPEPQGIVSGVAVNAADEMRAGMPVRVSGQPWVTLTAVDGSFQLVAPVGDVEVGVTDPDTGDTGFANIAVADPGVPVNQDLAAAPGGPRVVSISPSDGATRTARVLSVVIGFNEAVSPATVIGAAVALVAPDDSVVPASFSLNLKSTVVTLSPATDLEANTTYRVLLADTIADPGGLLIEGQTEFSFTTSPLSSRITTAQLVIYEPGAMNVPKEILDDIPAYEPGDDPFAIVVHGQPGVADPEVAVVLANESTGETSTVLSKPDGSFSSVITGTEEDFVSATFINLNGSRVYVPVSRQEFDDGFVGLYQQGGILEAESDGGPVQVIIQPEAIKSRTKFRTATIGLAELVQEQLGGVEPKTGSLLGRAISIETEGEPLNGDVSFEFPVDLNDVGFPENVDPELAALALVRVSDVQNVKSFEVMGQLKFTPRGEATSGIRAQGVGGNPGFLGSVSSILGLPLSNSRSVRNNDILAPLYIGNSPVLIQSRAIIGDEQSDQQTQGLSVDSLLSLQFEPVEFGTPLQGAFISLIDGLSPNRPGRLDPGTVYATTDSRGWALMVYPTFGLDTEANPRLEGTHPSFLDRVTRDPFPNLAEFDPGQVGYELFEFRRPAPFGAPATVNVAHTPVNPAPGEEVVVQVNASLGATAPPEVTVSVDSFFPPNLLPGEEIGIFDEVATVLANKRTRWTGKIQAPEVIREVVLRVSVSGASGAVHPDVLYPISFRGAPSPGDGPIVPSDPDETVGPVVVGSEPSSSGFVDEFGRITLHFNEPIDRMVETETGGILLSGSGEPFQPVVRLSPDQLELEIFYPNLIPDEEYSLTLTGVSVIDLNGNPLDQRPSEEGANAFTMSARTAPVRQINVPGAENPAASVVHGSRLYVLDRGSINLLRVYDISVPVSPTLLGSARLVGQPRDLCVIPGYQYKLNPDGPVFTRDLVAVVGGDLGSVEQIDQRLAVPQKYVRIFDVTDGANPTQLVSAAVSYRDATVLPKVRWHAPNLVYQEYGPDIQQIVFVNLQKMLLGFNSTQAQIDMFPADGTDGIDLNGDGDYVDSNEQLPLPQRSPAEFFGKHQSLVVAGSTQKILDFSVTGGTVGVTLTSGLNLAPDGQVVPTTRPIPPQYRTLLFNGQLVDGTQGSVDFELGDYPGRVFVVEDVEIEVEGEIKTAVLALVSLSPDKDGNHQLVVVDVSLPEAPEAINRIMIPEEIAGGVLESVVRREGSLLELATSRDVLLLDARSLALPTPSEDGLHPAIRGSIPFAGGRSKSLGTTEFGVHSTAGFGRNEVIQTAPRLSFAHFPGNPALVDPFGLPETDAELDAALSNLRVVDGLIPARAREERDQASQLDPADTEVHYHVLVNAPGGAGEKMKIGLESLSRSGWSLPNPGGGFPPVRAVDEQTLQALDMTLRPGCDAPIRPLTAFRLSNDPLSRYYNVYLTQPFAVVYESLSIEQLGELRSMANREILWSGAGMRAFIEPTEEGDPAVGDFAARIDSDLKEIRPIASVTAETLDVSYAMGPNPPPAGGSVALPGTHGAISAHSGEFRTEATDITLPSPRMPISIVRTIGGQDTYDGPFGLGWEFNYNQRITDLRPNLFPTGFKMPLIPRATVAESVIGDSKDLLFHSGQGRIVLFKWISDEMPPEYAADPLIQELEYASRVSDYFLPEPGVFDLLVKFDDGRYERLTPGGMRYKYAANGRLEEVIDRFPKNRHYLVYNDKGWLYRIYDRSVTSDRYVEFGYYRRSSDPDFVGDLDVATDNTFHIGKVCRIRDYADRDVLYFYNDEGLLVRRESFEVAGENGGFAGRNQTHYEYKDCRIVGVKVTKDGVPLLVSDTVESDRRAKVAQASAGFSGPNGISVEQNNSSMTLDGQESSVTQPDGRNTSYTFDSNGHLGAVDISGPDTEPARIVTDINKHGQPLVIVFPEGRTQTMTYDSANPIYRSRGNLLSTSVDTGPRGGDGYTETYNYDPMYNLPSGTHKDANGFTITYTLSGDGRFVRSIQRDEAGTETFDFDDHGQLTSRTDVDGIQVGYVYNGATGFVETARKGSNATTFGYGGGVAALLGKPTSVGPPRGAGIQYAYNSNLQEVSVTRGISVQKMAYDEQGRKIYHLEEMGDGTKRETRQVFEVNGFLRSRTIGGIEVEGSETTLEYKYDNDSMWRVKEILHPGGTKQTFAFNGLGYLTKMTLESYVEEYTPDLHGNVLEVKKGGDLVMSTEYDGLDRPTTIHTFTGEAEYLTEKTYFAGGQMKSQKVTDPTFGVVQETAANEIDALGRVLDSTILGDTVTRNDTYVHGLLERVNNGPRQTVRETWDSAGYPTGRVNSILTTAFTPDGNGNVETVLRAEDGATYADMFTYDDLDHRRTASDNFGPIATFDARADGRNLEVENARLNKTTMTYSALGEVLSRSRQDGMEFRFRHDEQRQKKFTGDTGDGFEFDYDQLFRMTKSTLRNGAESSYENFDARNNPQSVTIPGGTIESTYDLQQRVTAANARFGSTGYETSTKYDALNRVREVDYEQSGGTANKAVYTYDKAGPLLSADFDESGASFKVGYAYRNDLTRRQVIYPSGYVVNEIRDNAGRLTGISGTVDSIATVTEWAGNRQPKTVEFGGVLRASNLYDTRGRMTASRYQRINGQVQAEMRYQYDAANNVEMRQFLHRAGKTDNFSYDAGERLTRAQMGGIPVQGEAGVSRAIYQRGYGYNATGLDYLLTAPLTENGSPVPAFAQSWSGHDAFLLPGNVDGVGRGAPDELGRVAQSQLWTRPVAGTDPVPSISSMEHNGLGQLVRVERSDGVVIENFFQPGGLRHARRVTQGGSTVDHRQFVYDDAGRLLEEFDVTGGQPELIGRYFYMDSDAPCAVDLPDENGVLRRHYYIYDDQMSVVAVADRFGIVEERVWYDPFGQPVIEPLDEVSPEVTRIVVGDGGTLLIEFSEPVSPIVFDLGPGPGIRRLNPIYSDFVSEPAGLTDLPEVVPGYAPSTVVVFTPDEPLSGTVNLRIRPGNLSDDWDNHVEARTFTLDITGGAGTVLYQAAPVVITDSGTSTRSTIDSPFLFHGQYFDYETGLVYLRARFYDPFSGMFLEPDPLGYEDSVNLYAAFGNNPASKRDPSGLRDTDLGAIGFNAEENIRSEMKYNQMLVESAQEGASQSVSEKADVALDLIAGLGRGTWNLFNDNPIVNSRPWAYFKTIATETVAQEKVAKSIGPAIQSLGNEGQASGKLFGFLGKNVGRIATGFGFYFAGKGFLEGYNESLHGEFGKGVNDTVANGTALTMGGLNLMASAGWLGAAVEAAPFAPTLIAGLAVTYANVSINNALDGKRTFFMLPDSVYQGMVPAVMWGGMSVKDAFLATYDKEAAAKALQVEASRKQFEREYPKSSQAYHMGSFGPKY